jgi:SAM-dependent methyltransferase
VPSLLQNLSVWGKAYDWSQRGDEWSDSWGGVSYQWWTTLFPRLQGYVPAGRMLEIAPGYGRWTHFLRDLCDELIIVDIAEAAIEHCRTRFADDGHVRPHVNDGTSLAIARDESIDFAFSFDSLVHAESEIIAGYLSELARVLAADGVAFIHHSNMGAYEAGTYDRDNIHWRATTVSAALVARLAESLRLSCISQETVAWGNEILLNDCFSVITRAGSRWDRQIVTFENLDFTRTEIAMAHRFSTQYPPFARELRINFEPSAARQDAHAQALTLHENDEHEQAHAVLREQMRRTIDPEALNDLAVCAAACGNVTEAADLLRALVSLHPEHAPAVTNLAALEAQA